MKISLITLLISSLYPGWSCSEIFVAKTHVKVSTHGIRVRGGSSNFSPYSSTDNNLPTDGAHYGSWGGEDAAAQSHESVEDRIAAWRSHQQHRFENLSPMDAANPRDEDGRMKLLASVSRGSIAIFFFVLMWRSVHHFELADQSFRGTTRLLFVIPTVALFIGNMAGCVAAITSPTNSAKKRMKAILNLNKIVELLILIYNLIRLTIFPSKHVMREIYVGRTLTNFIFLVQCQLFTKVTWGATHVKAGTEWDQGHETSDAGIRPEPYTDYPKEYETYRRGSRPYY